MLLELSIRNFVIIEQGILQFDPALNIITGETGSGKSLVIDALSAISGGRFSKDDIRAGASKSVIEALFSIEGQEELALILEEYGIMPEEDGSLLIAREVNLQGKSTCRINGQIVTLTMLKRISQHLIDIVGQNEHQLLFNPAKHIAFLDSFMGSEVAPLKAALASAVKSITTAEERLAVLCGNTAERERKLDLLKFQIDEIEQAKLKPNEETDLKSRRLLLVNAEKLYKSVSQAYQSLYKGDNKAQAATDILNECLHGIQELLTIDSQTERFRSALESALLQLEDIQGDLRHYRDNIEFNDSETDRIEERLDQISKLKRKYGQSIEEITHYFEQIKDEFETLKNSEEIASALEKELEQLKSAYGKTALALSQKRKKSAAILEKLIEKELQDLNMSGSRFLIQITDNLRSISPNGTDKAEFLLSSNPGEPERPLSKIASGGEMSRVMLAIKNAFSKIEKAPSIVFDEVDSGVGGHTANMVGMKIKAISQSAQILCITHLPQIACLADSHIYLEKAVEQDKTYTQIRLLDTEDRILELARMMGGSSQDQSTLRLAKELLRKGAIETTA